MDQPQSGQPSPSHAAPGSGLPIGTLEEARALIGKPSAPRTGGIAVNAAMIQLLCGSLEDRNPRYWEGDESPPGLLQTWVLDLPWSPETGRGVPSIIRVPLPGDQVVNSGQQVEFFERIRVGDRLTMTARLNAISDEKETHLGVGHFVETQIDVTNQTGALVAVVTNTAFRYRAR